MKKRPFTLLSLAVIIGAAMCTTACSSDDNTDRRKIEPNKAQVAVLYYSLGGGDLDASTELDFISAAYEMAVGTRNVRYFVQHKYSSKKGYDEYCAMGKRKTSQFSYVMSGDYGGVYRFEMNWNLVNPQIANVYEEWNRDLETNGVPFLTGLESSKVGGADFKMYAPGNLTDFIRWSMTQASECQAFVLCIGDHGGAYSVTDDYDKKQMTRGILYDDNLDIGYSQKLSMSPKEIVQALSGLSGEERSKLKILYFDACMMNNLETLSELKGLVPYVIASSHSVSSADQGLLVKKMGESAGNLEAMVQRAGEFINEITDYKKKQYVKETDKNPLGANGDYTLTDMSKLDALIASVKAVREFLTRDANKALLTEKKAAYEAAASQCYQFFGAAPLYDVKDYVNKLRDNVFPDNAEFRTLADNVKKAAKAAMRAHADYSYMLDPVKGINSRGITYSITLGCTTEALSFAPSLGTIEKQGAIVNTPLTGSGTAGDEYMRCVTLEDGNGYYHLWLKGAAYDNKTFDGKMPTSASYKSWAATYRKTAFDKATGWSEWMRINPGVPVGNPPMGTTGQGAEWMVDDVR